jgi:hypothetical protein
MELALMLNSQTIAVSCEQPQGKPVICRGVSGDWGVTEGVLNEIKRQSTNGCLLCVLEQWPEEDWE